MTPKNILSSKMATTILLILLFALAICIIILGSVPPTSRDALTHHLFIPKLYIQHGGIFEIPDFSWSYYPMNLDLLYSIPLYLKNDIIPNYIHFLFAIATSWLIYSYLKKKLDRAFGLLGSLFFLSIPIILKLSITRYVDLGLIFFSTASLLFLLKWIENGFKLHTLIFSGVFCGLAVGTKYNGLITLFILTLILPILYTQSPAFKFNSRLKSSYGIAYSGFFLLTAFFFFSPWLIRNFIWTNNPFFPLFNSWFNHQVSSAPHASHLDIFSVRRVLFHESGLQILLLPFRVFFEGKDNIPQFFDGVLNPFLLILPLLAFINPRTNKALQFEKYAMLAFIILTFVLASFESDMRIRYISPIVPFLVILSILGLENILTICRKALSIASTKYSNIIGIIIVTAMLGYNIIYLVEQFKIVQPISYLNGKVSRERYISHFLPEYPVISYINTTLPLNIKILALYLGNRGYYLDRPVQFDPQNLISIFFDIIKQSDTAKDTLNALQRKGITHLLIRYDLFDNQSEQLLTDAKQLLTTDFIQNFTQKIFENNQYGLFKLGVNNILINKPMTLPMLPSTNKIN